MPGWVLTFMCLTKMKSLGTHKTMLCHWVCSQPTHRLITRMETLLTWWHECALSPIIGWLAIKLHWCQEDAQEVTLKKKKQEKKLNRESSCCILWEKRISFQTHFNTGKLLTYKAKQNHHHNHPNTKQNSKSCSILSTMSTFQPKITRYSKKTQRSY